MLITIQIDTDPEDMTIEDLNKLKQGLDDFLKEIATQVINKKPSEEG